MIWFKDYTIADVDWMARNNMVEHLGIQITQITDNSLVAKMPVDQRTRQPMNILHGGASMALAETLGSIASFMIIDPEKQLCVGMEINGNHLRPVAEGYVSGTATAVHIGRTTHVWSIEIKDQRNKLVCISRFTVAIKDK